MEQTAKQRYFKNKYNNAPEIPCACGCGELIKSVDKYARPVRYVNGHNKRVYTGEEATPKAIKKRWRDKNSKKRNDIKRAYYRARKLKAMALKDNKCSFCGVEYNGSNAPIFEFHHTNPSEKDAGLTRMLINKAWATTLKELDKCVLVCANCHNQHHGGAW